MFPLAHIECNKDESFKLNGIWVFKSYDNVQTGQTIT